MYNLQGTSVVPHGKMSLLNSITIACSCCQMTWQVVSFDNTLPSVWKCCWFLWQCQVSGTLSQLGKYREPLLGCRVCLGGWMFCFAKARRKDRAGSCIAKWWNLASCASRDKFFSLAHCQLVLPYPFLRPVTCQCFPREPGAGYLQKLSSKQACKHMLGSCWRQWDLSMLLKLITHTGGLLRCGWGAGIVLQMCWWEPWKSPWCCHIYKLLSCWTWVMHPPVFRGKALQGEGVWNGQALPKCSHIRAITEHQCWEQDCQCQ